jgi:glycosyltransferase involved in cell wall biosynthesis
MSAALMASSANVKVRLLHVVENLDRGAVENWLYRMFAAPTTNGSLYLWTFFCTLGKPGRLDDKIRRLGGEIIYSPYPLGEKRNFFFNLRKVINHGEYDVLHCHHDFVSAIYLSASLGTSVRKRIVHVHNTDEGLLTPSRTKQLLLKEPMRQTCLRLADNIVGISNEALARFTRRRTPRPGRDSVVYYGIDTAEFHQAICTREEFRLSLGLSPSAKLLLFTGRMVPLKNPCFVVEILAELAKTNSDVVALFAGAGELETRVRELATEKGLTDRIKVLGWRDDSTTLMRLSDVLIFPRLEEPKEGLGLVLVEAQAAGLPVLASPSITEDVQIIPELFTSMPLALGPQAWADATSNILSSPQLSREECLGRVEASQFSLEAGLANLLALYADTN